MQLLLHLIYQLYHFVNVYNHYFDDRLHSYWCIATGKAPTVIIQSNETGVVFKHLVENATQPMNITGSVLVPLNPQYNISIIFSNVTGTSEPFILEFGKYSV